MAHLIQTLSMAPLVSVSTGFSCISDLQIMPFHLILIPLLNTEGFNKSHNWPARPVILKWNAVELPESNHPSLHEKWKESQEKEEGRGGGRKEAFFWSICESWWQYQISVHALRHDKPGGWFSKSWGLSASISFLSSPSPPRSFTHPTPLPALLLTPLLRGLCLSFLVLCTETAWKCLLHSLIEVWVY